MTVTQSVKDAPHEYVKRQNRLKQQEYVLGCEYASEKRMSRLSRSGPE